jgi:hypothetical protein
MAVKVLQVNKVPLVCKAQKVPLAKWVILAFKELEVILVSRVLQGHKVQLVLMVSRALKETLVLKESKVKLVPEEHREKQALKV